jgi:hypothetical protein
MDPVLGMVGSAPYNTEERQVQSVECKVMPLGFLYREISESHGRILDVVIVTR